MRQAYLRFRRQQPALLLIAGTAGLCACTIQSNNPSLQGQDVHLTVIHTADIHSRILPYNFTPNKFDMEYGDVPAQAPYGGAARLSTYLLREQARSARYLHLDSGDCFEGAPIFNVFQGQAEMRMQTALGVDAMALGNHEFDLGPNVLATQISTWAGFPILAANYIFTDPTDPGANSLGDLIQPYTILNADGIKVAVLGFGNTESLNSLVEGGNGLGITPLDTGQTTDEYVSLLRPQADIIIAASHLGLDGDETDAQNLEGNEQDQVHGDVDLVLGGHLHIVLLPPHSIPVIVNNVPTGRNTVLAHSGAFAKTYGRLDLVVHMNTDAEIDADLVSNQAEALDAGTPVQQPRRAYLKAYDYSINPILARTLIDGDTCVTPNEDSSGTACTNTNADPTVGYCQFEVNPDNTRKACSLTATGSTAPCPEAGDTCLACSYCHMPEDGFIANILEPYILTLNTDLDLTRVFANAAVTDAIYRKNTNGGDSQLGNLVATSMRVEQDVQADFALTNSLGIRADMSPGPVTLEEMYNIFPFANTIVVLYMSGVEIKEMLDFVSQVSGTRGCQTQAQISGGAFVMDCTEGQSDLIMIGSGRACQTSADCTVSAAAMAGGATNEACGLDLGFCVDSQNPTAGTNTPCDFTKVTDPNDCAAYAAPDGTMHAQTCTGTYIPVCGKLLDPYQEYRVAVNDYIGAGGSGFLVLQRNTTKENTGLSLRNALIEYLENLDQPQNEGTYGCTGTPSQETCHGAIRCNDPRWATDPYLQTVDALPATTAAQYGCYDNDGKTNLNVSCLGDIVCVLPHNQQTDGRITTRIAQ